MIGVVIYDDASECSDSEQVAVDNRVTTWRCRTKTMSMQKTMTTRNWLSRQGPPCYAGQNLQVRRKINPSRKVRDRFSRHVMQDKIYKCAQK